MKKSLSFGIKYKMKTFFRNVVVNIYKRVCNSTILTIWMNWITEKSSWLKNTEVRLNIVLMQQYIDNGNIRGLENLHLKFLTESTTWIQLRYIASSYRLVGLHNLANELGLKSLSERTNLIKTQQTDALNIRLFSNHFTPIGHTAIIEIYIKAEILGIIPKKTNIILGDTEAFANPALVRYWEGYCAIISNNKIIDQLSTINDLVEEDLSTVFCKNGVTSDFLRFAMEVQLKWEKRDRPNLFTLTAEHLDMGYEYLRKQGMPSDAWFCGLHVREGSDKLRNVRNADINTYDLVIKTIADHGGWVVRMGETKWSKFTTTHPNVIDYAHSNVKLDALDVFILAEGRFFLGTGSGPAAVPSLFGKPVCYANWGPLLHRQWGNRDLLLPKQYWCTTEQRFLTAIERLSLKFGTTESSDALHNLDIKVIDNSPEELRDLVLEILNIIVPNSSQEQKKKAFKKLSFDKGVYPTNIAISFIEGYTNFI
jgi:putative glycosyltransferase (TIGR04372 family)